MCSKINGKTQVYGVVGNPIEHTISPFIHNMLSKKLNKNSVYIPYLVTKGELDKAIEGARALNIKGLNVTVPYKTEVLSSLYEITHFAKQIGAVNTIKLTKDGYLGYNTDVEGLHMSLLKHLVELKDSHCVIIGAGGAAKAVAVLCASKKAKKITIINRTLDRASQLADNIKKNYQVSLDIMSLKEIQKIGLFDIAIQTTSVGMWPDIDNNPIDDPDFYKKFHTAVDLIYNPKATAFLVKAQASGIKTLNGLEMLYFQAVRAYEIWNDISIDKNILEEVFWIVKNHIQ